MLDRPGQVPIYIIKDTLDECPDTTGAPSDCNEVLDFVDDLIRSKHPSLYICVTSPSRPIATLLYYAAHCGFTGLAKPLIVTHREDVNATRGRLGSPLHAASCEGADVNLTHGHVGAPLRSAYDSISRLCGVVTRGWNGCEHAKRRSLRNPPA